MKPSWQVTKLMLCPAAGRRRRGRRCRRCAWRPRRRSRIAAHEAADSVAVAAVPFGPGHPGEAAHLVEARGVPGLGDHRRAGQDRRDSIAQGSGGSAITSPRASRAKTLARSKRKPSTPRRSTQYSRQRTMKAGHQRVIAADGVAAAGEVAVAAPVGRIEHVDDVVGEALEVDDRARRRRPPRCG